MGVFVPVPYVIQMTVHHELYGEDIQNILHYYNQDYSVTLSRMDWLANRYLDFWRNFYSLGIPTVQRLKRLELIDCSDRHGLTYTLNAAPSDTGQDTLPCWPANVGMTLRFNTTNNRVHYRGKSVVGAVMRKFSDDGQSLNSTGLGAWRWLGAELLFQVSGPALLCVVSRFENNQPRSVGMVSIVSEVTPDRMLCQRRTRLPASRVI